ncbi:MAG: SDR family NAD(P)-dependent oxidoreductase [Deferribacteres bacterium]|nr:SDR family NAD(P)-dependent oxidoreductase [candidate division KSB1 bacterium]MCB9500799.1 SDR family NAD(P)-dependent oxidoreductase [Deferribacteres bacterium]MCB9503493.1 SDR family NAD(P)-dependent oxidoreductase [Deferribacteres bacterium]
MAKSDLLQAYWQNKTVLITGASSGLGIAITKALAPYHVTFGLLSRRKDKMVELAESLSQGNSRFWIRVCDVQDREDVYEAVNEFKEYAGRIDVVWVNAGVGAKSNLFKWEWESFESCMQTNLMGAVYTTKASLEVMIPQNHGAIVAISSVASMRGLPGSSAYSMTKIALNTMMESLATQARDIQFTSILPGWVETPMTAGRKNLWWLIPADKAAQKMITAVARKKFKYIYPWQMFLLYHAMRSLPTGFYIKAARKLFMGKKK